MPQLSKTRARTFELAVFDNEIFRMNDRDPVAEEFERFADDPLLLVMIFERKQIHRIEDDLQVIRCDGYRASASFFAASKRRAM